MNNVNIGAASIANVLSALEDIGFTIDSVNSTAKWGYDTNNKLYFKAETNSSNTILKLYNSSDSVIHFGVTMAAATQTKMSYERIGNTIVFGFLPVSSQGNCIQCIISEPKEVGDTWLYCVGHTNSSTGKNTIADGATENVIIYPVTALYNGSTNGVQLCRYYDGLRFCGNLYETPACASVQSIVNGNGTIAANNYIEATIDNDTYLIINHCNQAPLGVKLAIKKTTSST